MASFNHLRDFLQKQMRMSLIYQPVMIKELLERGGKANIRDIAAAFLARDESQLEYYEKITKEMPVKVLAKHGIVERDTVINIVLLSILPPYLRRSEMTLFNCATRRSAPIFKSAERLSTTIAEQRWATSPEVFAMRS